MQILDSVMPRLALSEATFMGDNLASEETGRLRAEMGAGARRVYQGGVL